MAIRWIKDVSEGEERKVGKKGNALASLSEYGLDVPRGFIVTAPTFETFVRSNGLENQIESILNNVDRSDINSVRRAQNRIKDLIMNADIAEDARDEIEEAYEKINMSEEVRNAGGDAVDLVGGQRETEFVAVRSSPTGSRIPGAHNTTLNVNGKSSVIQQIKKCWASLYSTEALAVEEHVGTIHSMAVVVQRMVEPEVSGTAFSTDPQDPDAQHYVVEALWGLGSALSDGSSTPDRFTVDQHGSIRENDVVNKEWKIVRDPTSGKNVKQRVANNQRDEPSIGSQDVNGIVDAIRKLEGRYGSTFHIDFALGRNRLYVLDAARFSPQRTGNNRQPDRDQSSTFNDPFVAGRGASPGNVRGPVRVLYNDMGVDTVGDEEVMAVVTASERLIPVLTDAAGFVADRGGMASNLSTLARKLDVPGVVGAGNATDMLAQSEPVTLDGSAGAILEEEIRDDPHEDTTSEPASAFDDREPATVSDTLTATRVKVLGTDMTDAADGAVVPDFTEYQQARQLAEHYQPERAWVRTEQPDHVVDDRVGVISQRLRGEVNGKGAVLTTYGEVMRSNGLVDRGVTFIGLDVNTLKENGDRESLVNAIQKIGEETVTNCESALLLRDMDSELVQTAVEHGIDSIAVPPAYVVSAREAVARAEKRFMLEKLRRL